MNDFVSYLVWITLLALIIPTSSQFFLDNIIYEAPIVDLYDDWCINHCHSIPTCNDYFGDNHVDLRLQSNFSILKGPGEILTKEIFLGDTISRQSFETQFILDVAATLSISPCRLYILSIDPLSIDNFWDYDNVVITFRLIPAEIEKIRLLTEQIQDPNSSFYNGAVTSATDAKYGVVALKWDFTIKVTYSIEIVGGDLLSLGDNNQDDMLNQGSKRWCMSKNTTNAAYCEFENLFKRDLERALAIDFDLIDVLFIKAAALDSVFVTFRLYPFVDTKQSIPSLEWIDSRYKSLIHLVQSEQSSLYSGNVTFRLDPTWGVGGLNRSVRSDSKKLRRSVGKSPQDEYERCKASRRCSRGWNKYIQQSAASISTSQVFAGGMHESIPLFADFEDWRQGTFGWIPSNEITDKLWTPKGGHWSPFTFKSVGPNIPSFNTSSNNGLVLNRGKLHDQIKKQEIWIKSIQDYISWLDHEMNISSLDAKTRFRKDIQINMATTRDDYKAKLIKEKKKLETLSISQCTLVECVLNFNTSNLQLYGAINASGVIETSPNGIEVAVWAFDSIDLDENVQVFVTGQRPISLVSKSSIYLDAQFDVIPGTLGGFPGGYSIFRDKLHRMISICNEDASKSWRMVQYVSCEGDQPLLKSQPDTVSNNVNGPGSSSSRIYLAVIQTWGEVVKEIQVIRTDARKGQILGGGFTLHFNGYSSSFISHDCSSTRLKMIIEDTLNVAKVNILGDIDRVGIFPGIGRVDVSRLPFGTSGGYEWKITFITAVGNPSQLQAKNLLKGVDASISITTLVDGNSIGGTFSISMFGFETRLLPHDVTATSMKTAILDDVPVIKDAVVIRTDPLGHCDDGLCKDRVQQAGGYDWTITIYTDVGNVTPLTPLSSKYDEEGKIEEIVINNFLTGCVNMVCPNATVTMGHGKSSVKAMTKIIHSKPFSLALGGAGGSYGGKGGIGATNQISSYPYGDELISDLYGGSGGAAGYIEPFQMGLVTNPSTIRGGSGGGAVEIVAINDAVIGKNAKISCRGEDGGDGYMSAGGGGSGGSILLSAGGILRIAGVLDVTGGNGGRLTISNNTLQPVTWGSGGGGGSGGRVALYGKIVTVDDDDTIHVEGGKCGSVTGNYEFCDGSKGTLYTDGYLNYDMYLDDTEGALGTNSSLLLRSKSKKPLSASTGLNIWPQYTFDGYFHPGRISFSIKFGTQDNRKPNRGWGSSFFIKSRLKYNETDSDKNTINALAFEIGREMKHGIVLQGGTPNVNYIENNRSFFEMTSLDRWYKIDIRLNWSKLYYDVYMDDVLLVENANLTLQNVYAIAISVRDTNVQTWFDEIYVGDDTTLGFKCPNHHEQDVDTLVVERGWLPSEIGGPSYNHQKKRHESHLSRRALYSRLDKAGLAPFDGEGHRAYTLDVQSGLGDSTFSENVGLFKSGSLLTSIDAAYKHVYFWYGEYEVGVNETIVSRASSNIGGVVSCSTTDFITWKNEGIMFHYVNLTDMVQGSDGPFHAEKPKVLFNSKTNKYVMWIIVDNQQRSLGMAGVATSDYPNGPFTFLRSFYPDGNRTRDQTVYQDEAGDGYLIRTYYDTIDVNLPSAVMQPIWESVKNEDGTTNFGLTYHRAFYEEGYDDFHDIYLQRWREEDKIWQVVCIDRVTGKERQVSFGKEYLTSEGEICIQPFEYKKVIGLGYPLLEENDNTGVKSRFLDPNDPSNNIWKPDSVPGVRAQAWKYNYEDGSCGKSPADDNLQRYDPDLPNRSKRNRATCSNVVDNPVHPTPPDLRIGRMETVERRRTKFVAISKLTDDYLDTTGIIHRYEGEIDTQNADLSSIVNNAKKYFDLRNESNLISEDNSKAKADPIYSDKFKQEMDWDTRFHQYERNYNDRAFYSPACVLNGDCPVNFKDQVDINNAFPT